MTEGNASQFIIYQTEDGQTRLDVRFVEETVWLSQQQMAALFQTSRTNIVEHIGNVYAEGELLESATCREFRQVQTEGSRQVTRALPFYNLDSDFDRAVKQLPKPPGKKSLGRNSARKKPTTKKKDI